jgi:pilus assembly protein Flp/PilA
MVRAMYIAAHLLKDESGQDLIEYALVAAIIALGAVVSMKTLSNSIKNFLGGVGNTLTNSI